jgi:hypothetical protein
VPVMSAPRDGVPIDLPFPSLIDWDSFALFTDNFDTISKVLLAPSPILLQILPNQSHFDRSDTLPIALVLLMVHVSSATVLLVVRVPFAMALIVMHAAGGRWDRSDGEGARETRWKRGESEAAADAQVCQADRFRLLRFHA